MPPRKYSRPMCRCPVGECYGFARCRRNMDYCDEEPDVLRPRARTYERRDYTAGHAGEEDPRETEQDGET